MATGTLATLGGCRAITLAYGPDVASARINADGVFSALEQRYTKVTRDPKFTNARMRIARYALTPSKLEGDTAVWTARSGSSGATRELTLEGTTQNQHYAFNTRSSAGLPRLVGDSRHIMRLSPLAEDEYQWATDVDHNVGAIPPARVGAVFTALLASAERAPSSIRTDYRAAFPRTTLAVGRLFVLDSVSTLAQSDGSMVVTMHVLMDANRLRTTNPLMAQYVDKYISTARYQLTLTDNTGAVWFDANADHGERVVLRFRSRNGALQPVTGAPRSMPDSLQITVNAQAKFGMFTVGVSDMIGSFVQVRTPTDRGWLMRFQKEPDWHLPLAAKQLLRSPLRRPFAGSGILFRVGFRNAPNWPTMMYRKFDVAVHESAIMRFLGSLGFGAMNDYSGEVEAEENRFLAEMFAAMRADVRGLP
ncbi:MAG: hypothetical protein ABJB74_01440 [Gemmatimonas sp.]